MAHPIIPDFDVIKVALAGKCPKCREGSIFEEGFTMDIRKTCGTCGLNLGDHDCGDGPAVFLIFILGTVLVPAALLLEFTLYPPIWVHIALWSVIALSFTLGSLRPLKAYIVALQYKHDVGALKK
jgi:uncharacterized protein (DUF983 family)